MGEILICSIKSALCVTAFYLLFKAFLSRETFFTFNRFALISLIMLSLALPLIHLQTTVDAAVNTGMADLETLVTADIPSVETSGSGIPLPALLLIIYMAGVAFFLIKEVWSLISLYAMIKKGCKADSADGIRIIVVKEDITPFSWFRNVVISEADYSPSARSILIHEREHALHRHSADILLCDALIIFQWYNPAAWLMKAELQAVHEYEADNAVLNSGVDAAGYQLLLIRKAVGDRLFTMVNNLNNNSLKKRIAMMLSKKSNPLNRFKILFAVPVAAVAVAAFASDKAEMVSNEIALQGDYVMEQVLPQSAGDTRSVGTQADAAQLPAGSNETAVKTGGGTEGEGVMPVAADDDDKVLNIVEEMPEFPGGNVAMMKFIAENVKYPATAVAKNIEGRVVVIFVVARDGTIKNAEITRSVSPDLDAEALRVVNSMPKWKPGRIKGKPVNVRYTIPVSFRLNAGKTAEKAKPADASQLGAKYIVVDGKQMAAEEFVKLSPSSIQNIEVFKGEDAVKRYGDIGKDGVLVVTLRK